ncbi:hypothetical protein DAPPUDRAFT_248178 [Daphnia pulex]|uniref:Uncharacterized protein n=1 Tax=Daphnia pulex TaxID=6669 RepID=E9GTV3_DAPPU|nr:hypothetical protein DAPPUDRAFT_248178 [Daphnia pulex]|eukprot:EFX77143.1 hypothetical protein DAPPUDRAFT_248178 [Daphnia pulex]
MDPEPIKQLKKLPAGENLKKRPWLRRVEVQEACVQDAASGREATAFAAHTRQLASLLRLYVTGQTEKIIKMCAKGLDSNIHCQETGVANATRSSLRAFADQLESHIRGLEALGTAPAFYGDLLVCFLIEKLAIDVRRNLTRHQGNADWTLDELRDAIQREIEVMEDTCELQLPRPALKQVNFPPTQPSQPFTGRPCPFCTGDHSPTHCTEFKGSEDRAQIIVRLVFAARGVINRITPVYTTSDHRNGSGTYQTTQETSGRGYIV